MKQRNHMIPALHAVQSLPLSWLPLSWFLRLLLVIASYIVGTVGLLIFFPLAHNGATMFLPIMSACWLFRYRGLLVSMILNGLIFQVAYELMFHGMLSHQDFTNGALLGFFTSLFLGLLVCWLRVAVDRLHETRLRMFTARQESALKAKEAELMGQAYERERRLNALKDQLVLMLNHELRTPLTAVKGYLELLIDYDKILKPADRGRYLVKAHSCCLELTDHLETTLESAQAAQQIRPPRWEALSLYEQVINVIETLDPQKIYISRFHVEVPSTLVVWADQQYLRQILQNLLSNAMKYSPDASPIYIGVDGERKEGADRVTFWIQDLGKGIPPDKISLLFGMFVRLERELTSTVRGLGLGLYISQSLIHEMGGEIVVESSGIEGEGSRFSATLPTQMPPHQRQVPAPTGQTHLSSLQSR